jgi:hypothetical protein
MTDWKAWSRIVDAAQDPQHRDAVQKYLAQVELTGEIPAALDERLLAPRRTAGASDQQCAYVYSNLGFAALIAGTRESAEFAIGCGRLVEQLAPESPDLALRRHFMMTKGGLMLAVVTGQPHWRWSNAARQCIAYLGSIDRNLEELPPEGLQPNAMAAYSFTAQLLSRVAENRAVAYYATEVSELVDVALRLADRLPSAFAARMWTGIMPGTDAGVFFRQKGAAAERTLQAGADSPDHARKGIAYTDEIIARSRDRSNPDLASTLQTRAELLLMAGRLGEAMEQVEALEKLSDQTPPRQAILLKARHQLKQGNPQAAIELLAQISPTPEQAVEHWQTAWLSDAGEGHWTHRSDGLPGPENDQEIWRLQAVAAAALDDVPAFREAVDRSTGFLADSLLQDRQGWADRVRGSGGGQSPAPNRSNRRAGAATVEPMPALEDVAAHLADGTALLQVADTGEGLLTWVAVKRAGKLAGSLAPGRPNANRLREKHKNWSNERAGAGQRDAGTSGCRHDPADAYAGLMNEVRRVWGNLLQELLEDGVSQLILIGDDLVDIPLHATRIGSGEDRLIDRVPVAFVPSLFALRACVARTPVGVGRRQALELRSLAESEPGTAEALAEILGSKRFRVSPPIDDSFFANAAAAQVLHVAAQVTHNPRRPLDSVLGKGWLDLTIAGLLEGLDLPRCEVVSILSGEIALPSMLRARGFDLATLFLAAGARNVLASTWPAGDGLASELAELYFRRWVSGCTPSAAFRDAILQMRTEHSSLEDFDWAGMRLVGAP